MDYVRLQEHLSAQLSSETNARQENEQEALQRELRDDGALPVTSSHPRARWRLKPLWRKLLLSTHLIVSVGLLGSDAAVLILCLAGAHGADPRTVYPAASLIAGTLLVPLAVLALVTGIILALLTPWGLVRYWWVAISLALTVGGIVLGTFVLVPTLAAAADAATAAPGARVLSVDRLGLVKDTSAAFVALIATVLLSVYKPFGRLLDSRRRMTR